MIAAADIGGHTLTVGLVENARVLRKTTVATPVERTPQAVCTVIKALLSELGTAAETPLVLGVPGFVLDGTTIGGCPNQRNWEGMTASELSGLTGRTVTLANDCDLFALGELSAGAARDLNDFVFITLGTGVGGSVIVDRRLVRGAHGRTGEIGHFALLEDVGCGCGGRGHLESFFSATAFEREAAKLGMEPDMRALWARRENAWLARPFAQGTRALACVLSSLTCLLDPQAIVFGGGLSHLDGLLDDLRDYMFPLLPRAYLPGPELRLASLENEAPLLGAEELLKNRPRG